MLYDVGPMGYFGRVTQYARGPWFREYWYVEDDGENWWYRYDDENGARYLLSNNMNVKDRTEFDRLYWAHNRACKAAYAAGFFLSFELHTRHAFFTTMTRRNRMLSFIGVGALFASSFNQFNAARYGPLMGAYLRKYHDVSANDLFEITDRRREFFHIDTSSYMNYEHKDLPHGHVNYGPQPDNEVRDASWLISLDKFLNNEEHHGLKEHQKYLDYNFDFKDKSFPSEEAAKDLIHKH